MNSNTPILKVKEYAQTNFDPIFLPKQGPNPLEWPRISIVTPSYNQGQFIEETIRSVLLQGYPNLEYIIIDGGSTDNSVEIIKKYEKYLTYWVSEPDQGQYDSINKGFAHSTGEIMAWINSDDMYLPFSFKTVASIMSQLEEVEWLTTLNTIAWDWNGFCTGICSIPGYSKEAFLDGFYLPWGKNSRGWIQQESTFWRRSLWSKVDSHIRTEFSLAGDFDLWSRFFMYSDLYGTNSPLGGFRKRFDQRSKNPQYKIEANRSLEQMQNLLDWKLNYLTSKLIQSKLLKLPKLESVIRKNYGFNGKKVVKKNYEQPDINWETEEYKFI